MVRFFTDIFHSGDYIKYRNEAESNGFKGNQVGQFIDFNMQKNELNEQVRLNKLLGINSQNCGPRPQNNSFGPQQNPMAGMMQMMQMMLPLMMLDKDGSLGIKDMLKDMLKGESGKTGTETSKKSDDNGTTVSGNTKTTTRKNGKIKTTLVTDLDDNKQSKTIEGSACYEINGKKYGKAEIDYSKKSLLKQ